MIKIENLSKIYRTKKKSACKALDNVNLCLPDTGLVFVLGKSGSGKSTLLNLIGGLDSITRGKILVDGNDLSKFKQRAFTNYRNNHIGFIFQDYHLLEEMTVYENVALSLNLRTIEDADAVNNAICKVGLAGYQNRYPNELSGGEQQRVAIARALVKRPRIVLADEPTGNLDPKTAASIIEILKRLSKECLVLIVSHNTNDAYKYADRIIELSGGKILKDYCKNKDYPDQLVCEGGTLFYPMDYLLSEEDVATINEGLRGKTLKQMVRRTDKFQETGKLTQAGKKVVINNNNLSIADVCRLSGKFLKNKLSRIFLSGFMVSALIICLALAQTIVFFDANKIVTDYMQSCEQTSMILKKQSSKEAKLVFQTQYNGRVGEGDVQAFRDAGFDGEIYPVLSYSIPITTHSNAMGIARNCFSTGLYIIESMGTLQVDEAFLERKFGQVKYLARAEEEHPLGLIITDYIADAVLASNKLYAGKTYEDLLGKYTYLSSTSRRVYINGIIETGYKEEHGDLFERFDAKEFKDQISLHEDEAFLNFSNDVFDRIGLCYTLNPNFREDYANSEELDVFWHHKLCFDGKFNYMSSNNPYVTHDTKQKFDLGEGEVAMHYMRYNEIFGTTYTPTTLKDFQPHSVTVAQYMPGDLENKNPLMQTTVYIKALASASDTSGLMIVDDKTYALFGKTSVYELGLYFDSSKNISPVLNLTGALDYEQQIIAIEGVHTMTKAVNAFVSIFEILNSVLCIAVVFIIVNFAMKMIKDKTHDIGILKALGTKTGTLCAVFGLQIGLIALLTSIFSTVGYAIFIDLANDVLIASLQEIAESHVVLDLHFLNFSPTIAMFDMAIVVFLSILSLVIPMQRIYRIQPVQIIKTKE